MKMAGKLADQVKQSLEFHQESAKLTFALELKRFLEREGLSNGDLAERLGVSRPMVSKLLRGDTNVTIETMVKASRTVGGSLFLKIVRDGCSVRLFELAQAEMARGIEHRVVAKMGPAPQVAQDAWKMAANDYGDVEQNYEKEPLAA